jgi:hypothetical protein
MKAPMASLNFLSFSKISFIFLACTQRVCISFVAGLKY